MATNNRKLEDFYSVAEIARSMGVSKRTVCDWIHDGRLKAVRPGNAFRVPKSAFDDFLKSRAEDKAEAAVENLH